VDFHSVIAEKSGSDFLPIIRITSSNSVTRLARKMWVGDDSSLEGIRRHLLHDGNERHREVLEVIEARDSVHAEEAVRVHIQSTTGAIRQSAKRHNQSRPSGSDRS
jgi:DNA-binding GntR family transcriptional regulator